MLFSSLRCCQDAGQKGQDDLLWADSNAAAAGKASAQEPNIPLLSRRCNIFQHWGLTL